MAIPRRIARPIAPTTIPIGSVEVTSTVGGGVAIGVGVLVSSVAEKIIPFSNHTIT